MSYKSPVSHRSMALDDHRNQFYLRALQELVTPETIVMDLGAGLGIHGIMAAKLGAAKVYLVEPHTNLSVAKAIAEQNNVSDKLVYVPSTIEAAQIPEKVDIIISVFTGNLLFQEDLLPSLFYARDRYLAPDGHLLPDLARVFLTPIDAVSLYEKHIASWSQPTAGINMGAVSQHACNDIYFDDMSQENIAYLSDPTQILEMNFKNSARADGAGDAETIIQQDGQCHGLLGWFDIRLHDEWLSTSPLSTSTHWSQAYLPLEPPLALKQGEAVNLGLQRPQHGEWSWSLKSASGFQQHSTFLSQPISAEELAQRADNYQPTLNKQGQIAKDLLSRLNGSNTNAELARCLFDAHADYFTSVEQAQIFVDEVLRDYT